MPRTSALSDARLAALFGDSSDDAVKHITMAHSHIKKAIDSGNMDSAPDSKASGLQANDFLAKLLGMTPEQMQQASDDSSYDEGGDGDVEIGDTIGDQDIGAVGRKRAAS